MKLMRTLLEGEGVCSGVGEGGTDCSGEIEGDGGSPGVGEGVGVVAVGRHVGVEGVVQEELALGVVVILQRGEISYCCHVERSRDISNCLMRRALPAISRDLIRSLSTRSAFGLPVHLAASPATRFSTLLGMTEAKHSNASSH